MMPQIFFLSCFSLLVLSLPERYSIPVTNTGTSLIAAIFTSSPSKTTTCPKNEAWEEWKEASEETLHDVIDYSARSLKEKYASIVGEVTFHSSTSWTHVLWIDKGAKTPDLPFPIQKNAPVLVGSTLIGIVDFVGAHASRIRLLSDPTVRPGVRIKRGGYMSRQAIFMANELEITLQKDPSIMPNDQLAQKLISLLGILSENMHEDCELRLAKGELQGCESPETPSLFRGTGFNCDFPDEYGPKRDLRTGQSEQNEEPIQLIKPGDILETNGLDGIFPKGIDIAFVTKVFPLEEGAISYNILATSLAPDFSALEYVTIIRALSDEPLHPQTSEEKILDLVQASYKGA